ncbi:MAG: hypothetical protein IJO72_02695 [Oscillospiraceae bacterium]|nr:hypothetical protein [Oscillospiraceae bacterium]
MVSVGQILWGINKETGVEETVEVIEVGADYFRVVYNGLKCRYPFSAVNSIFYTEPRKKQNNTAERKCDNCFLRYTGNCSSLAEVVCEDFRVRQVLPQEDIDNWPKYGDATAYKLGDKQRFKK